MNLNACSKTVEISLIDFTDFSYSISPDRDISLDETFKHSIARHGILHPPIIRETDSGSYVIVTGRKRLSALRSLSPEATTCNCLVVPPQVPDIDVYSIMLEDISIFRQPTPVEKAILLDKISPYADVRYIADEFMPRLDLPPDPFHIRQYLMLLDLEKPIILAIHKRLVHESVARDISSFTPTDRMAVFNIMVSLRLSVGYQKKLVAVCREITSREKRSIAEFLASEEVRGILDHQEANPPQKAKNLMAYLTRKHMPRSSQAEAEFNNFAAAMQLPRNVTIQHTPFFEDDTLTLSIIFTDRKSLQEAWEKIENALQKKEY